MLFIVACVCVSFRVFLFSLGKQSSSGGGILGTQGVTEGWRVTR